ETSITYLTAQTKAGARVIQIFASWGGALNKADYKYYLAPGMKRTISAVKAQNVPEIIFGVGDSHLATEWDKLGSDVLALDWRMSIAEVRELGITKALQVNLDPAILLSDLSIIEERAKKIVEEGNRTGHIFNLGHGVFPEVSPDVLKRLTELVHTHSKGL